MRKGQIRVDLHGVMLTIICDADNLLGFFNYGSVLKLAETSKKMRETIIEKTKSLKKVLKFGNLESSLRTQMWTKLIDLPNLEPTIRSMVP